MVLQSKNGKWIHESKILKIPKESHKGYLEIPAIEIPSSVLTIMKGTEHY